MAPGTHRDEGRPFTRYIGTLYTICSSTDDRGLSKAKTFRASMRSAAAVCRELCVAKR